MAKNRIKYLPKTEDEFIATNRHLLSRLTVSPTRKDVTRGYERLFESMSGWLNKYHLRVDVGWDPPDHMYFIRAEPDGKVALFRSNNGSPEPADLFQVGNVLFPPTDILRALISQLSDIGKSNQQELRELELVTSCVRRAKLSE